MTFWTYNARHKVFAPYQMSFSPMFMFLVLSWIIGFGPALRIDGRWGQMGWKGTDARSPLLLQFSLRVRLRVWASLCHINRLLTSVCTYSNSSNRSLCMRLPAVGVVETAAGEKKLSRVANCCRSIFCAVGSQLNTCTDTRAPSLCTLAMALAECAHFRAVCNAKRWKLRLALFLAP